MKLFVFCMFICSLVNAEVPKNSNEVSPILVGENLPDAKIRSVKDQELSLKKVTENKPTVLVFYRGGWCPYCNLHLKELKDIEAKLISLGYQIIAISPDRVSKFKDSMKKYDLKYKIFSDSKMEAAKALGIAFQVDQPTIKKYKKYRINLQEASGESHRMLPVPAVFIVNKTGQIVFSYVNPNYKVRLKSEVLLSAAKAYKE